MVTHRDLAVRRCTRPQAPVPVCAVLVWLGTATAATAVASECHAHAACSRRSDPKAQIASNLRHAAALLVCRADRIALQPDHLGSVGEAALAHRYSSHLVRRHAEIPGNVRERLAAPGACDDLLRAPRLGSCSVACATSRASMLFGIQLTILAREPRPVKHASGPARQFMLATQRRSSRRSNRSVGEAGTR